MKKELSAGNPCRHRLHPIEMRMQAVSRRAPRLAEQCRTLDPNGSSSADGIIALAIFGGQVPAGVASDPGSSTAC